ncbi:hypothetical protein [Sphingomonas sp. 2378]|uniref:hypothetical protein n=1 Tax=Sphingomonas sp. 2378 TaxID=1219748 RepID=UPI00311B0D30
MIGYTFLSDAEPYPDQPKHWQVVMRQRTPRRTWYAPRLRDQWAQLAQAADQLLDARRKKDPASIAKRRMTVATARQRERIMAAVAALWRDVERRKELAAPIDWPQVYGATWLEMLTDLRTVAQAATALTDQTMAGCAIALAWHFEPITDGGPPHIVVAADYVRNAPRPNREAA